MDLREQLKRIENRHFDDWTPDGRASQMAVAMLIDFNRELIKRIEQLESAAVDPHRLDNINQRLFAVETEVKSNGNDLDSVYDEVFGIGEAPFTNDGGEVFALPIGVWFL